MLKRRVDKLETKNRSKTLMMDKIHEARPGDIFLFRRARGINRIITWFSGSPYYHVGIYAGNYHVVESRPQGVVWRDLRSDGGDKVFDVIPAPENKGREALSWAMPHIGDGYAVFSVGALVLDRLFRRLSINIKQRHQFSCGEFVAKAFLHAGVDLFPQTEPELVAPWDFAQFLPVDPH